ncbi:MAG: UDP-N-acetylmuramoyl-L-alanine--D-glutamate ligase [Anaerolinea sp.]|nr:UDP-N-acetylmuramoyl-L-alanine--D-glutamate ligase [Anaerolinea sp.]
MMMDWKGKRVLIIGAARQGQALARFLAGHGATVTLNDKQTDEQLARVKSSLQDVDIHWISGGHPVSALQNIDLVCLSGGVPLTNPLVVEANKLGIAISNDTQIFMEHVPAQVIGITGSAGKTTTTTLVGRMAKEAVTGKVNAWIGGNIGNPLIADVDRMKKDDLVIMEVSSFQLEQMTISPAIGAVLNITPNHLDRHGTMEAYTALKARLLAFQTPEDIAILNRDDAGSSGLAPSCKGRIYTFGMEQDGSTNPQTFVSNHRIYFAEHGHAIQLLDVADIQLRGEHNLMNVLAACAIACAAGFDTRAIQCGIQDFTGVPHRMQFIRDYHGAKWYNDSIATTPERSMAAIRSFSEPIVLLAGGRDKDLLWVDFARLVHQRVFHLVLFGEAAGKIKTAIDKVNIGSNVVTIDMCGSLQEAVGIAANYARSGYVVLLSPGGTSFDEFLDFEKRGEAFSQWVQELS